MIKINILISLLSYPSDLLVKMFYILVKNNVGLWYILLLDILVDLLFLNVFFLYIFLLDVLICFIAHGLIIKNFPAFNNVAFLEFVAIVQ